MTPEEIKFLKETAELLKKENAPVLLEYGDVHNRAFGRITDVKAGGIVFHDDGAREDVNDYLTWSQIDRMQRRPLASGMGEVPRSKAAGK